MKESLQKIVGKYGAAGGIAVIVGIALTVYFTDLSLDQILLALGLK